MNQPLRDSTQRVIGYIETKADGSQVGRNANSVIVGYYDPCSNMTRNANQVVIAYGDLLASLIAGH